MEETDSLDWHPETTWVLPITIFAEAASIMLYLISWSARCSKRRLVDIQRMEMPMCTLEHVLLTAARWTDPIETSLLETIGNGEESFCWAIFVFIGLDERLAGHFAETL